MSLKRISRDFYERIVPATRSDHPARLAWGVGDHIIFVGKNPERVDAVRAFLAESALDAYIEVDVQGVFVEFHDAGAAMLFWLRFR